MNINLNKIFRSLFVCLSFFYVLCLFSCNEDDSAKSKSEVEVVDGKDAQQNSGEDAKESLDKNEEKKSNEEEASAEAEKLPPSPKEIGYAYGVILAKAVRMNHLDVDAKAIYKGYMDSVDEEDINMAPQEVILRRAFAEGKKKYAKENLAKQEKFLEENKNADGVVVLESGLQYKVLKEGDKSSPQAKKDSKVKIVYTGKSLGADREFDSSQGEAVEMSLANVIEGWKEIVPIMHIGDEFEVYIPANLGYGEEGIGYQGQEIIPPNALLIFKIELKEILPSEVKEEANNTGDVSE